MWANVTKFGQNFIAPQIFLGWYGYGCKPTYIDWFEFYLHSSTSASSLPIHFRKQFKLLLNFYKYDNNFYFIPKL